MKLILEKTTAKRDSCFAGQLAKVAPIGAFDLLDGRNFWLAVSVLKCQ